MDELKNIIAKRVRFGADAMSIPANKKRNERKRQNKNWEGKKIEVKKREKKNKRSLLMLPSSSPMVFGAL